MIPQAAIAHYRISAKLGEGGMGVVYRATDTKLHRDVAIKVLPDAFARDPDRLARFTREAQVLASLNHPNIAAIYGVEERALVLELVEGPTLADRIAKGPIPTDESIAIARQIAEALEYAHERGIIHRDLKPSNIKVTPEGRVKVLDFGLAKAFGSTGGTVEADPNTSPTMTMEATVAGVILGTAAYMSPEQARGKPVDRRADIWAFGVVLMEMLTGTPMFSCGAITETLAAVIAKEHDFSTLPANTPANVRMLLRRCLDRDPNHRLRDIGEGRIALEEPSSPADAPPPARRSIVPWALFSLSMLISCALAFLHFRAPPSDAQTMRLTLPPPEGGRFNSFAVAPDGRQIAYSAFDSSGTTKLWVRRLESATAQPLAGTEGATLPFWSPDSRHIGFFSFNRIQRIDASGGPAQTLCNISGLSLGASWNRSGNILFSSGGLWIVPANGGVPAAVALPDDAESNLGTAWPWFLPDGRHYLYTVGSLLPEVAGLYVGSLDSTKRTRLGPMSNPVLAGRFLLFVLKGTLMAQPFDPETLQLSGVAVRAADSMSTLGTGGGRYSAGPGVLIYDQTPAPATQLTWFDRQGRLLRSVAGLGGTVYPRISPDGKRILSTSFNDWQIYVTDIARNIAARFTFSSARKSAPVWSPDGNRVFFACGSGEKYQICEKPANGAGEELVVMRSDRSKYPNDVSPDGRYLIFAEISPQTSYDLMLLSLADRNAHDPKPLVYLQTPANEMAAVFSPDGKWIAYGSDESGLSEIYLRPFFPPEGGSAPDASPRGQWQISKGGGHFPKWRADGKELFYYSKDGKITAVSIETSPSPEIGDPRPLFSAYSAVDPRFAVTSDGQRFLLSAGSSEVRGEPATVVVNWQAALKE